MDDGSLRPHAGSGAAPSAAGPGMPGHPSGAGGPPAYPTEVRSGAGAPNDATAPDEGDRRLPERPVREHGGAEDFRAVAPPVMSFAQGRRR
jgi:hypothetical protein